MRASRILVFFLIAASLVFLEILFANIALSTLPASDLFMGAPSNHIFSKTHAAVNSNVFDESLLVLMNSVVGDATALANGIRWIQEDSSEVCQFHSSCQWEINMVFVNLHLMEAFREASSKFPPNVNWRGKVSSSPFNKFTFINDRLGQMASYDLVLIKDSDQRIVGIPWRTFIEKRSSAVVSGPLRRRSVTDKKRDKFQFHEAGQYISLSSPQWSFDLYYNRTAVEVPLLEMYFVLFDAQFAHSFFGLILRERFLSQLSSWGPGMMWCQAAKSWDTSRPGCYLVPVVSTLEATRQMTKGAGFPQRGNAITESFKADPIFGQWMVPSWEWVRIIEGTNLHEIEQKCRDLLGLMPTDYFDIQTCSMKPQFSYIHYNQQLQFHHLQHMNATGSWASCFPHDTLIWKTAPPPIRDNHHDSAYVTISCTRIRYRLPSHMLGGIRNANSRFVVGVLSSGSRDGPSRRNSIRSTWADGKANVLFIVAGPWSDIKDEYEKYGDMLWIDMRETYSTETSILTFKTQAFLSISYEQIMTKSQSVKYLFKTDDDSYVAMERLERVFFDEVWGDGGLDYWGKCQEGKKPHRNQIVPWKKKWNISFQAYPEQSYPTYCQGAGYALSRRFLDCAIGDGHAAMIRYMPNEDVAVGMLAERCNMKASSDNRVSIRFDKKNAIGNMYGNVVQHYVTTSDEMHIFHMNMRNSQ